MRFHYAVSVWKIKIALINNKLVVMIGLITSSRFEENTLAALKQAENLNYMYVKILE